MFFSARQIAAALALGSLFSVALPGFAAEPTDLQRFLELDSNEDGFLSGKEAVDVKQFDANNDGRITQKEYLDGLATQRAASDDLGEDEAFAKADGNEDGVLSGKEMRGYEKYDKSGDGEISKAEFSAGHLLGRLRAAGTQEARKRAEEMFAQLDINEDDRLSGTEMQLVKHYDTNGDGRVTREEFLAGATSVPPPPSVPPPSIAPPVPAPTRPTIAPPRTDLPLPPVPRPASNGTPLDPMVAALKTGDPKPFMALMNPLLTQQINAPVLELYLVLLKRELGEPTAPTPGEVETVPGGDDDAPSTSTVATIKCSQGETKFEITMQSGKITGFNFGGPNVTTALYEELASDKALALKFGKFYTPGCQAFIQAMLSGQDDEALACFHPEVRKGLDKDSVKTFFQRNRNTFGELQSLELASFRVNYDENKVPKSFDLDFDMVGKTGKGVATATLLFNGLRCWMIHFAVENSKAEDDK